MFNHDTWLTDLGNECVVRLEEGDLAGRALIGDDQLRVDDRVRRDALGGVRANG